MIIAILHNLRVCPRRETPDIGELRRMGMYVAMQTHLAGRTYWCYGHSGLVGGHS